MKMDKLSLCICFKTEGSLWKVKLKIDADILQFYDTTAFKEKHYMLHCSIYLIQ